VADALPILLIPGLSCSARLYAEQIPMLWQFGPVTVVDHRRAESMTEIAAAVLREAPPRFALAGLSMGGYIAFEILRQAPQRVARLALLDTAARADTPEASARRDSLIALARAGRFPETTEALWPALVHRDRQADATLKAIVVQMADDTGAEAFVRQQTALKARADSRPALPAIRCPTLVLVGEGDTLTPLERAEEMAAAIPGARLVTVPESGHLSTLEQPAAVNRAMAEWMQMDRNAA
jgi:pimeloyl-ACP methyl ester carboxylesterase